MTSRYCLIATSLVVLLGGAVPAVATDKEFRAGLSAYNKGDFIGAFRIWLQQAELGYANSQAGLGFLFHRGLGVQANSREAAHWLRQGADQGQAEAQLMLGMLYFYGSGVPQSYVHAFAWCDLAQTHGQDSATLCRNTASDQLTVEQQKQAFALVNEWMRRQPARP